MSTPTPEQVTAAAAAWRRALPLIEEKARRAETLAGLQERLRKLEQNRTHSAALASALDLQIVANQGLLAELDQRISQALKAQEES